ncbi:MAG: hypothetical protein J5725_10325 [Bacteroidales bacterium]|nr:hypothetical protein [Bacteroidales bacterium]
MTVVVVVAWFVMSVFFEKQGCPDEYIYIGTTIMLAAQYVRASIMDKRKAKMDMDEVGNGRV